MSQHFATSISRYVCAIASVALAIWVRRLLDPVLGRNFPFATVWLAVLATAWYGGFRPALTAVVLGALALNYFLLAPRGNIELTSLERQVGMALYIVTGLGIALLAGSMHAAEAAARTANDLLESRVRERTTELAQANDRLQASEAHFRVIVEGVRSHAMFMLDSAGHVASWNPGSERIKGYRADEIVGRHFSQFYTPEDIASGKPQRGMQIAITEGCFEEEDVRVRKDGSRFWAIVTITPLYDLDPDPIGFLIVTRDLTERKKVQEALAAERTLLRTLIDALPNVVYTKDTAGRYVVCNRALVQFHGLAQESDLAGKTVLDLFPRPLAELYRADDLKALAGEPVLNHEAPCVDAQGNRRWHSAIKVPLRDPTGAITGLVGISTDITERKRAEEALRESEARFRGAFDNTNVAMVLTDTENRFLQVNAAFARLFGYAPAEMLSLTMADLTHPDDLAESYAHREALMAGTANHFEMEKRYLRKDGCVIWGLTNVSLLRDLHGQPLQYVGQVQDITERKQAEESRNLFRALLDRSDDAIEVIDPDTGCFLDANEKAWQSLGYSREEFMALRVSDIDPVVANVSWGERMENLRRSTFQVFETEHRRKDGSVFPVEVNAKYVRLHRDYSVAVVRDITERKQAESALRQQQRRLEGIVNSAMDGIITIDADQRVILVNAAAERMFGYLAKDVLGQSVDRFMPERFRAGHADHVREFGRTGIAARDMGRFGPISGRRADGEEFPIEASISQVQVEGGKLFTVTCRDVTERVRAAETQEKLEAQLHQSQKMEAFGQLAGGVAHDFNNLLTVISGYSEVLLTMLPLEDAKREMVSPILHASERAASLTRQLLAFSRRQVLEPRVLDLNVVITDTEKMLRRLIGEDVQLASVLSPNLSPVKIDPGQIEQVIMNLAVNARDAMPQGGKLTIETSDVELDESFAKSHPDALPGQFVLLAISDTGCGMTNEVKARVFEPFFTTKGVGKGTGLGLAVVHGIVKQSGGSIDVYSELGAGTAFKIYLPAVQERPANLTDTVQAHSPRGLETILLVEDDESVREFAALALQEFGYTVLKAPGGAAALQLLASQPPSPPLEPGRIGGIDLLVTDVVMLGMSGRQLAETLRVDNPGLKVLFLSGYTDDAVVRHGVLQANVAFLQKPFTLSSLARKVREVLDHK